MSLLIRNHNSDPGREKTPRPIRERLLKINMALSSTIRAVQYEKTHGIGEKDESMFRSTYAKWITGHEVVAPGHSRTRIAKAAPVVAESIDKMEVTAKASGQIDLNATHQFDPDLFRAMVEDNGDFEAKVDSPKLGAQDAPDAPIVDGEDGAKLYRIADARRKVEEARPQEGADNAVTPKAA